MTGDAGEVLQRGLVSAPTRAAMPTSGLSGRTRRPLRAISNRTERGRFFALLAEICHSAFGQLQSYKIAYAASAFGTRVVKSERPGRVVTRLSALRPGRVVCRRSGLSCQLTMSGRRLSPGLRQSIPCFAKDLPNA